jgi:hypothetical protein
MFFRVRIFNQQHYDYCPRACLWVLDWEAAHRGLLCQSANKSLASPALRPARHVRQWTRRHGRALVHATTGATYHSSSI